jgi:hypothetical protein
MLGIFMPALVVTFSRKFLFNGSLVLKNQTQITSFAFLKIKNTLPLWTFLVCLPQKVPLFAATVWPPVSPSIIVGGPFFELISLLHQKFRNI